MGASMKFMMKGFRSPENETSIWKNIPISLVDGVQKYLRETYGESLRSNDSRFLYRYRGPRRSSLRGSQMCLKADANRFSVYIVDKNCYND